MRYPDVDEKQFVRAKNAAYRYLTYRPRSRAELSAKLEEKEFDDAIVTAVLVDLARLGYVDDRQFAGQWTRSRIRLRGFGRRRIEQELKAKGVGPEIIQETFAEVFDNDPEIETAKHVAEKKLASMKSVAGETRRRRLAGFLERKGFTFDVIREVLRGTEKG